VTRFHSTVELRQLRILHETSSHPDFTDATRGVYRRTLQALADDLEHGIRVHEISSAALQRHLRGRYGEATPATFNRNLAKTVSYCLPRSTHPDLITDATTSLIMVTCQVLRTRQSSTVGDSMAL